MPSVKTTRSEEAPPPSSSAPQSPIVPAKENILNYDLMVIDNLVIFRTKYQHPLLQALLTSVGNYVYVPKTVFTCSQPGHKTTQMLVYTHQTAVIQFPSNIYLQWTDKAKPATWTHVQCGTNEAAKLFASDIANSLKWLVEVWFAEKNVKPRETPIQAIDVKSFSEVLVTEL